MIQAMIAPLVRPRTTYEELCRLPPDGHRYELFDGEAFVSPSPSLDHQRILRRLYEAFSSAIRDASEVFFAPMDVVLGEATALQPDLVFVRQGNRRILQDVIRGVPDLVVEVLSPATAALDRGLKLETYAHFGIPEYWIVDGTSRSIEIHRLDETAGAYRRVEICQSGDRASTPLLPSLAVDPGVLFG